ncbi:MAG: sugar phosphate nucleotidyltransferase [Actinomycetes bacterium]
MSSPSVPTDAVIVAGGRGTRLQPLTHDTPKPLLPFCGAPFLSGVIRRLARAGVTRVLLVVGQDTEPFRVLRADAAAVGVTVETVPEPEPLDTAGGVRAIVDELSTPFLVLNGDILTDVDYAEVLATHAASGADASIVLTRVEDTSSFGVCVREGTRIVDFVEKPAPGTLPGQDAVNAGTYVLHPDVLRAHPEGRLSFERAVFPGLVERGGHLEGIVHEGVWADLGTPDRLREGHRLALSGALPWPSVDAVPDRGDGVRVAPGARVHPDARLLGPVLVLGGAEVASGAVVGPDVVLGADSAVGPDAVLVDTALSDRARLGAGVEARGLLAGVGAHVEAGVALGRDVVLGDGERVSAGTSVPDGARLPAPRG